MAPSSVPLPSSNSPVADRVHDLVAPAVAAIDVELVDVEWTGGTLRVTVDNDGGITTEQLAAVHRLISPLLDQHDPVAGRYLLEVSSPGVERKLRTPDHFVRAIGEDVTLKLVPTVQPRRVRGRLTAVDNQRLTVAAVEIDGVERPTIETLHIDLANVAKARTVFDWDSIPKQPKKRKKRKNKKNRSSNVSSAEQALPDDTTTGETVADQDPSTQDRDDRTD